MAKKNKLKKIPTDPKKLVIGGTIIVALGALAFMVLVLPKSQGSQTGVGANGFSVFEKKGADLGVTDIVDKKVVQNALGSQAKSVDDVTKSGVISLAGNLGQTATYNFTNTSGSKSWIDIDVLKYSTQSSMTADDLSKGTGTAGKVNNMEVRFLPARTLGQEREYTLLVSKGLNSYKYSMSQPTKSKDIPEFKAWDILKAIIAKSDL